MITKAIIEEIVDAHSAKIRIPLYDKASYAPNSVSKDNLSIATICSLPNCICNYAVGDVVFVTFEENERRLPIIMGQLERDNIKEASLSINASTLSVNTDAYLPEETHIGDVSAKEIQYLKGLNENLQVQLNILSERIAKLEKGK